MHSGLVHRTYRHCGYPPVLITTVFLNLTMVSVMHAPVALSLTASTWPLLATAAFSAAFVLIWAAASTSFYKDTAEYVAIGLDDVFYPAPDLHSDSDDEALALDVLDQDGDAPPAIPDWLYSETGDDIDLRDLV